jgi:hypothetical protein
MQTVLKQAVAALPDCVMLAFARADLFESSKETGTAQSIYEV